MSGPLITSETVGALLSILASTNVSRKVAIRELWAGLGLSEAEATQIVDAHPGWAGHVLDPVLDLEPGACPVHEPPTSEDEARLTTCPYCAEAAGLKPMRRP